MSGTDEPDPARVAFCLEPAEVGSPGHQVVNLLKVDDAVEHGQLRGKLLLPGFRRWGPDLCGDPCSRAAGSQGPGKCALRSAVHGGGVESPDAFRERCVNNLLDSG